MEEQEGAHEIEERNGRSLKYHKGRPGDYVGVTKRVGKRKTSYIARLSHTKRKGDERRLYYIGTFPSAVEAAVAIAKAEADECGPLSPEGDRKPRTCTHPAARLSFTLLCLTARV